MDRPVSPIDDVRALFDVPEDIVYLNAASKSVVLRASIRAGEIGAAAKGRPWAIDEPARYRQADRIRARFARFIGAAADDIAIQPAASYGIATAAKNISAGPGQRVLILEGQYPSNVYAWRRLADAGGADLVTVPWPEDGDWTRAVLERVDERLAVAALPPCHWTDGLRLDLGRIGAAVKSVGACFVVDATQWVGAQPIDVTEIGADYLVCAAYKWLLGPYGLAFMYAAPDRQAGLPLEEHLFNRGGVESIEHGLDYPDVFTAGARRFDSGEFLNLITLPMIEAALGQIEEWSIARIGAALAPITAAIAARAESLGLDCGPETFRSPHIVGVRREGGFPADIRTRLVAQGVHVSARGGALRVSPYVFNGIPDADRFAHALESALANG